MCKHLVAALLISMVAFGCGDTQQKYNQQVQVQPSALDAFRANISALVKSNQLDSGTAGLVDDVDKLKGVEGVNVDQLKPMVQKLANEPRNVGANAKAILALLPPEKSNADTSKTP